MHLFQTELAYTTYSIESQGFNKLTDHNWWVSVGPNDCSLPREKTNQFLNMRVMIYFPSENASSVHRGRQWFHGSLKKRRNIKQGNQQARNVQIRE